MTTISVSDLEADRSYVRTSKGRWLNYGGIVRNSLYWHDVRTPNYHTYWQNGETILEISKQKPKLMAGDLFSLLIPKDVHSLLPDQNLMFQIDHKEFPFRIRLVDYRLIIPFWFESTDPRVGVAQAEWSCPAGKLLHHLKNSPLQIFWDDNKPFLAVIGLQEMLIPSQ